MPSNNKQTKSDRYWRNLAGEKRELLPVAPIIKHDGYLYPFDMFACCWGGRSGMFLHAKVLTDIYVLDPNDSIDGQYRVLAKIEQ
jgi:hypothetical protein